MRVTDVEISETVFNAQAGAHFAQVVLRLSDAAGNLVSDGYYLSRAAMDEHAEPMTIRKALIDDALRQARRMPEYRNGRQELSMDADYGPMVA
ncbi:hypothetical protein [Aliiroseovarius marinus]|uniref:hypothetical protein n=1 Tax=Aliiroseovarius marinus TaxID=2500159 RepID=UPI003D7C8DEA